MKVLLDQALPRGTANELRARGVDATHTGEIGLSTATDEEVIQRAREEQRVVVTFDADFHALLALSNATSPSVVRVRVQGLRAAELASVIEGVLTRCADELREGALISVDENAIRLRSLPLIKI